MDPRELADKMADDLAEHFESVIIIATRTEGTEGTNVVCKRRGNYYATKGAITEWLEDERNRDLVDKMRGNSEP